MKLCQECIDAIVHAIEQAEKSAEPESGCLVVDFGPPVSKSECEFPKHKELHDMLHWFQSYNWIQVKGDKTYQTPHQEYEGWKRY